MKTLLHGLFLLCTTAALAQSSVVGSALNNQPTLIEVPSHPQQASPRPMARTASLLENGGSFHAVGKRPLWEVMPIRETMPLGDIARILRKEHETAKKANVVVEN